VNDGDQPYDRQIEHRIGALEGGLEKVEGRVGKLETWRTWLLGAAAGLGLALGASGREMLHKLFG
jgi:hypothetical protein